MVHGGKLHLAPIGDNPNRVLDVGTGTGGNLTFSRNPALISI